MREEIIFVWQRERREDKLVPVREDFFKTIQRYLLHLSTMAKEDENPTARNIFQRLYTRTNFLVNDLIDLRVQKIFKAALHDEMMNLNEEESSLYKSLHKSLLSHRRRLLGIRVTDEEPVPEQLDNNTNASPTDDEEKIDYCTVEFLDNELEETLGPDLLSYGPFYKGDFAVIPLENAHELEKRNKVTILKLEH